MDQSVTFRKRVKIVDNRLLEFSLGGILWSRRLSRKEKEKIVVWSNG